MTIRNIVEAFRGMHVSPAKHSYMCDYQESVTTGQRDAGQSDPYVPLCFAGDTTSVSTIVPTERLIKRSQSLRNWQNNFLR